MFMESPFYFDMMLQERLELIREHEARLYTESPSKSNYTFGRTIYKKKNSDIIAKLIVGYFLVKELVNHGL